MAKQFKVAIAAPDGSLTAPSFTFESAPDTGMYLKSGALYFTADALDILAVDFEGVYIFDSTFIYFADLTIQEGSVYAGNDVVADNQVTHKHGTTRSTAMMDLEVLTWMG